jgi:hypothetical protein
MLNHREYGFSSKNLCVRPYVPMGADKTDGVGGQPAPCLKINEVGNTEADKRNARAEMIKAVDKLEQQVKDALFGRTTPHIGMERVLKNAFTKFDVDCSGTVDYHEFNKALEYLGLHTEDEGLEGHGGLPRAVVVALFERYDTSGDGMVEYEEFCEALLSSDKASKML